MLPEFVLKYRFFGEDKPQGIVDTQGTHWSTQRRFSLKTLKDFGFGKKSIEDSIHFEAEEMIDKCFESEDDIYIGSDFNIPIINVLWRMVANKRFNSTDPEDLALIDRVSFLFETGQMMSVQDTLVSPKNDQ